MELPRQTLATTIFRYVNVYTAIEDVFTELQVDVRTMETWQRWYTYVGLHEPLVACCFPISTAFEGCCSYKAGVIRRTRSAIDNLVRWGEHRVSLA